MFGNVYESTISQSTNGFVALGEFDSNGDGNVNAQDANFAQIKIWQDTNHDGISEASELKSLSELGITNLNLAYTVNLVDNNGNAISEWGTFTRSDGTTGTLADVSFQRDLINTVYTGN